MQVPGTNSGNHTAQGKGVYRELGLERSLR